jgi:hypothetical protein
MILFDGSTNYELGNISLLQRNNKPDLIHVDLYKNTTVIEKPGQGGEPSVIRVGRRYEVKGLHDLIVEFDVKSVGHFIVHAMDPQGRRRLDSLLDLVTKHHRAELSMTIRLIGDTVPSEPGMAPFEVKLLAQPGNWCGFPFRRPAFA